MFRFVAALKFRFYINKLKLKRPSGEPHARQPQNRQIPAAVKIREI